MNTHTCESLNNAMVCSTLTLYLKKFELLRLTADALNIWPASRHWSLTCIKLWPKLLLSFPRKLPYLSTCIERMIDRNIKVWITILELYKNAVSTSNHESCWCHGRQPTTKHTALIAQTISLSWGTAVLTWLLALISLLASRINTTTGILSLLLRNGIGINRCSRGGLAGGGQRGGASARIGATPEFPLKSCFCGF